MNLVLLGPPGSGKGTQAKLLIQKLGLVLIVMGDEIRKLKTDSKISTMLSKGELITDEIIFNILKKCINNKKDNFLIDGLPRNIKQAVELDKLLKIDKAVLLDVDDIKVLVSRIKGRLLCPKCKADYHVEFKKPKRVGVCDKCNTRLIKRIDDNEDVLKNRIRIYKENIKDIILFYKKTSRLCKFNADQNYVTLHEQIMKSLIS